MMLVYTSITKSYLPKARVLAKSLKRFHPDWLFVLLYSDDLPVGFELEQEPFDEILFIEQLGIPNWKSWAFGHSIVELCTAVKGPAAELLAKRPEVNKIIYIDPDIKIFNSLESIESLLDQYDVLLTPHLLDPEQELMAILDNEICAMKHGVFNLGFVAVKTSGQGLDFIHWWAERLRLFCHSDIPNGIFTDQRWCDLAPGFFSKLYIVRDRGCNVATWNIFHRRISKNENDVLFAGDVPLRFYHFTGYDNGDGLTMLSRYASDQPFAFEVWDTYGKELLAEGQGDKRYKGWYFGKFGNGEIIPDKARQIYRERPDFLQAFPDPYSVTEQCFYNWWKNETAQTNVRKNINFGKRSLQHAVKRIIIGLSSPKVSIKIVLNTLNHKGLSGLIKELMR